MELAIANAWLIPTAPAAAWREPSPLADVLASSDARPRVYRAVRWWPDEFGTSFSTNRLEQIVAWERAALAGKYALLDDIALVNAQVGIKSAEHERLLAPLSDSTFAADDVAAWQAVDRLGVEYLILPESIAPAFASRVAASDLPSGATLWRVTRPRSSSPPIQYASDHRPLVTGAIISGLSWLALFVVGFVYALRRRSNTNSKR
jgi:hypothetical protein